MWPLFFFAEDQKRNFSFKERKKTKKKTKKRRILDPVFDWGLALNPIAFIPLSRKVYYILTNSPPPSVTIQERWLRRRRKKVRM